MFSCENWSVHRGAFCQSSFRWIYFYGSNKSTGKETGKLHLCALVDYADLTTEESSAGLHVHIKSRTSTLVQSDRRTTVKLISDLTVSKL